MTGCGFGGSGGGGAGGDGGVRGLTFGGELAIDEVGDDFDVERGAVFLAAVEARAEDDGRIGAGAEVEV